MSGEPRAEGARREAERSGAAVEAPEGAAECQEGAAGARERGARAKNRVALFWITVVCVITGTLGFMFALWLRGRPSGP